MTQNLIASRIADFLKEYPPFHHLSDSDLARIAENSQVQYLVEGDYVFKQNESPNNRLYVVKEGMVELRREQKGTSHLIDQCDEGDIFGVRAMLSGKNYVFSAYCKEESLLYALPLEEFSALLKQYPEIALFFASGLAGGQVKVIDRDSEESPQLDAKELDDGSSLISWNIPLKKVSKQLVSVPQNATIQQAAEKMNIESVGSLIIKDDDGKSIGIITDTDFRKLLGAGKVTQKDPVNGMMSKRLISMPLNRPLSEYLLSMLENRIRHIALTDGQETVGIISERDLMASHHNHPLALSYAIGRAQSLEELVSLRNVADRFVRYYLEQRVSTDLTAQLISHINDQVLKKCIALALEDLGLRSEDLHYCWINLGSAGRKEQILRTDQDNALIIDDDKVSESDYDKYRNLAKRVNEFLAACGFEKCPADMMAGNPKWCQPLTKWKEYFKEWIISPAEKNVMLATIFFDFRAIEGDTSLADQLQSYIFSVVEKEKIFINFLAANALKNPPPLSFFKNFVVEESGEHKNDFDLKLRALMPYIDIARVLGLYYQCEAGVGTLERLRWAMEKDPQNEKLYQEAILAFRYLLGFRASEGLKHTNSGRYIDLSILPKIERQQVRNTFRPISELQRILEVKFQLAYFR